MEEETPTSDVLMDGDREQLHGNDCDAQRTTPSYASVLEQIVTQLLSWEIEKKLHTGRVKRTNYSFL